MSNIENLRKKVIEDLFTGGKSFSTSWEVWQPQIIEILNTSSNPLYDLGSNLRDIFFSSNISEARTNSDVSGGGAAWERLVAWYLNLNFLGTRNIAFQKMSHVPEGIRKAFTVSFGPTQCNTESDITVVTFPLGFDSLDLNCSKKFQSERIEQYLLDNFGEFEVGIIQCKTNWNDNAQIPMAWNIIYNARSFRDTQIAVGVQGYSIHNLSRFTYSFVTVPTQKDLTKNYKNTSAAVLRVRGLSGGNYWGCPSVNGVAQSVGEIFNRNFSNGYREPMNISNRRVIAALREDIDVASLFRVQNLVALDPV